MWLILVFLSLSLASCNEGGSKTPSQTRSPAPTATAAPTAPPVDYSQITCGSIEGCATVCDLLYPHATDSEIKYDVCSPSSYSTGGATCAALINWHDSTYLPPNQICRAQSVAEIINSTALSSAPCSSVSGCSERCSTSFVPQPFSGSAGSGEVLRARVRDFLLVRDQLFACLMAPAGYIMQ